MLRVHSLFPLLILTATALSACSDDVVIDPTFPKLVVDPLSLSFGKVPLNQEKELVISLKNDGSALLHVEASEGAEFTDQFAFRLDRADVQPNSQALLTVTFKPTSTGLKSSSLRVRSNDPDNPGPIEIALDGEGASAGIVVDPVGLSFGNVVVLSNKTLSISVTNNSGIIADVKYLPGSNVKFCGAQGQDPSTFCFAPTTKVLNAQSEFRLDPNESATFNVTFRPTFAGARESGNFSLQACPTCDPVRVTLDGLGIEQGFSCMPASLEFGLVNPNSCATLNVVCTNVANEQLSVVNWGLSQNVGSSPDFEIEAFGNVSVLNQGESVDVDVTYCPLDLGNDSGVLEIETDNPDPRRRFATVQLSGNGGGPDIDVQPVTLNFGQVSLIAPSRRTIQVANVGFARLDITEILVDTQGTGAFTTMQVGEQVPVGGFYDITIEFQPVTEGPVESTVIIKSNDTDEREVTVRLIGEGINLPPCNFEVVPATLGFGVVQRSRVASRAFEVRNLGASDCLVTAARMVPGSDTEFSLPDGDVMSLRIAPQSSAAFRVEYSPADAVTHTGGVEFSISSPTNPFNTVNLSGTGADAVLLITPNDIDFGTIGIGCGARPRLITIYNTGATPARITSIGLAAPGNPAFTITDVQAPLPAMPLTLAPGASTSFNVVFRAAAQAQYASAVEINGEFGGAPVTYLVSLQGEGAVDATQVDEFDQLGRPKVDILLVIDDSCSMFEEQTGLSTNLNAFLQFAQAQQIDYQIAVTTTDVDGNSGSEDGRFVPMNGNPADRIVTPQTQPSPESVFATNINQGTGGSGFEQGLEAGYLALSSPLIFGHNAGFLRTDAVLSIIFVSDEPDSSPGTVDFYTNFFLSIKGFRNTNLFTASAIVGDAPGGCDGPGGNAGDGFRYVEVARRGGGIFQSICTSDWQRALEDLSTLAFGFKSRFFLSNQPVITSLIVLVDDVPIDRRSPGGTVNWEYDFATNSVNFTSFATPEPGAHIRIEYTVECL